MCLVRRRGGLRRHSLRVPQGAKIENPRTCTAFRGLERNLYMRARTHVITSVCGHVRVGVHALRVGVCACVPVCMRVCVCVCVCVGVCEGVGVWICRRVNMWACGRGRATSSGICRLFRRVKVYHEELLLLMQHHKSGALDLERKGTRGRARSSN